MKASETISTAIRAAKAQGQPAIVAYLTAGFPEPANFIEQAVEWQGRERHYFEIMWDGHRIWGATAAMIVNLGRRMHYQP